MPTNAATEWEDGLRVSHVPHLADRAALAARLTAPAGPPRPLLVRWASMRLLALPGRYCMVYVIVEGANAALVDVGSSEDLPLVLRALEWLGVGPRGVSLVVATHLHFDHVMGLDAATSTTGAELALGEVSRAAVESGTPIPWPRRLGAIRAIPGWFMQGAPVMPSVDRDRGLGFGFPWAENRFTSRLAPTLVHGHALPGFEGWTVLAAPGHSSDSICLHHAQAGVLVAGDSVRNFRGGEWNGLTDDAGQYERTKAKLLALPVRVACPGHGPVLVGDGILSRLATIGFWGRRVTTGQRA